MITQSQVTKQAPKQEQTDDELLQAICDVSWDDMKPQKNLASLLIEEFETAENALQGVLAYFRKQGKAPPIV